ncbi:MAG: PKD domain-containing protein [Acidobacteriota bacterium]|nr:PKD domain-containing protein [Acidobacteriota bacterium]MDD8038429.1 PKD domain-containing protein [Acidobacteriota bacterium]
MKRSFLLSIGAVLFLATVSFGLTLGHPKLISKTTDRVRWTQCAFGPDGVLWVVWVPGDTNRGSGGPVWVASYDGTVVRGPDNVTESTAVLANRPHISVSPKGSVIVSWGIDADKSIHLRIRDVQGSWGAIETVSTGLGGDEPAAFMDKAGNIHVVFSDEVGGSVYALSKINGAWENAVKLSTGFGQHGSLALGTDGAAHAVWVERSGSSGNNYENYYAKRTASTSWSTGEALTGQSGSAAHPWVTVGTNHVPVVAWEDLPDPDKPGGGSEIRVMMVGETARLAIAVGLNHFPRVVVDRNGAAHVACQSGRGDAGNGIRYTNDASGTFQAVQTIAGVYPKLAGLAADPYGNVAATQSSYLTSGGTDIWAYSLNLIAAVPAPIAAFTFSPSTGYPPLAVTFQAAAAFGPNGEEVNYDWVFGDGGTASGRNVNHVYQASGTYNVRLTVADSIGRTDEEIKQIVVLRTVPLPPVNLSASIAMTRFWENPEITFNLYWAANPDNIAEHVDGYVIYMRENDGSYNRLLTVSSSTFSVSFAFTNLQVSRSFAVSTLGKGGTESAPAYFQ